MKQWIGEADICLITLDTLRFDVAQAAWKSGLLETLGPFLGSAGWEERHTPASFTFAAHQAFLAGFLPTPACPGTHPRLYAAQFAGSTTTCDDTFSFEQATLPQALEARGYQTACIGGTGFFNLQNELSRVIPGYFQQAYWSTNLGVTCPDSAINQAEQAIGILKAAGSQRVFLLINFSALHQPNWFYAPEQCPDRQDNLQSHLAALLTIDRALKPLFSMMQTRGPSFHIVCSDHGTAYGEEGYRGHRCGHPVVWTVPYIDFVLPQLKIDKICSVSANDSTTASGR